jgi:hypothetical protein
MKRPPPLWRRAQRSLFFAIAAGWAVAAAVAHAADEDVFPSHVTAPVPLATAASESSSPFEKQFRADTGEGARTARIALDREVRVPVGAKKTVTLKFDLAAWAESQRAGARLWAAVGAPDRITTEGPLQVSFSQNGLGMTTGIDHTFNVDGTILMGCDYAVRDGAVVVEIENSNHSAEVVCSVHAILYVPAAPISPTARTTPTPATGRSGE